MNAYTDNLRAIGAGFAYGDLQQQAEDEALLIDLRQKHMAEDFAAALCLSPHTLVKTPAWGWDRRTAPAVDVIYDDFARPADTSLADLLRIVARAAKGGDAAAQQWIKEAAARYAAAHAADDVRGVVL